MRLCRPAFVAALSILATVLAPAIPATAANALWSSYGGQWTGTWEDTDHNHWWPYAATTYYPHNGLGGVNWTVQFNGGAVSYAVEVTNSHPVTWISSTTAPGHVVELTNWLGSRIYLQFDTFTNSGGLHVNNIDLYGLITNQGEWTVRGGMVNYNGDVTNHADAVWNTKGNLEVKGTFTNHSHARSYGGATLWADEFVNNDRISLLGGSVGSDAEFANNSGAAVAGAGSLYAPAGIDNQGTIRAETGTLAVYCGEGTLTSTGHLENLPNTALVIQADTADHQGTMTVGSGGGITFTSCDLENPAAATVALLGGTLAAPNLTNRSGGGFSGFGGITASLTNQGLIDLYGPSQIVGNVQNDLGAELAIRNADLLIDGDTVNDGTIRAVNGKVYFEGDLTDNGTIVMDPSLAVVVGDLVVGPSGALVGDAGSTYQMMGRFDNRSTRRAAFDLAATTVEFVWRHAGAGPTEMEVAGKDLGPAAAGWTDNFAVGTMRVGNQAWPGHVQLVDVRDNQADGLPEALYAHDLSVAAGSTLETGGRPVYADGTVEVAGTIDLATGGLVLDYDGASPFSTILAEVAAGSAGGAWDGVGICSSAAAADPRDVTALGITDDGFRVTVDYTWYGDANLDGVVDSNDYDKIDTAWTLWTKEGLVPEGGFRWFVGDFDHDGTIDSNDYDRIDNAWLFSEGGPVGGGTPPAPTPEPATLALLALGLVAAALRRRPR